MKEEFDTLLEDTTLGSNNAMGVGGTGMSLKPQKVTFMDLFDHYKKQKADGEEGKAPTLQPYPADSGVLEAISDSYVKLQDAKSGMLEVAKNPIVKDNKPALKAAANVYKKLQKAQKIILSLQSDLDGLTID
jgi:hypothetical protein